MSKQQKAIRDYIINAIDWVGHGYEDRPNTMDELRKLALHEMQYNNSGKSDYECIVDWLQGLGGPFGLPYTYYDIQQFMLSMGYKKWDLYDKSYRNRLAFIIYNCN